MTGLEKIIQEILNESQETAARTLDEAARQAKEITELAKRQSEEEKNRILEQAQTEADELLERAKSAAQLEKRKRILSAKQEIIQNVIDRTKESILSLTSEYYFDLILKMAKEHVQPMEGKILFSKTDLNRLPTGFESQLNKAIERKEAVLCVAEEAAEIDGGFILIYGGIEENCSLEAIFESRREELVDKVHELLFP